MLGDLRPINKDNLKSGFKFEIPLKMFKVDKLNTSELRVFAFSNGVATELNYFKGFK